MTALSIRLARRDEAAMLSALARRSKAHWGYSADFIEACRAELTVAGDLIDDGRVMVAVIGPSVVGFGSLIGDGATAEIDMLFVEPEHIGEGIGAVLLSALRDAASHAGFRRLRIVADPNAATFYEHHGARHVGEEPSASVPGRMLPVLELELELLS